MYELVARNKSSLNPCRHRLVGGGPSPRVIYPAEQRYAAYVTQRRAARHLSESVLTFFEIRRRLWKEGFRPPGKSQQESLVPSEQRDVLAIAPIALKTIVSAGSANLNKLSCAYCYIR